MHEARNVTIASPKQSLMCGHYQAFSGSRFNYFLSMVAKGSSKSEVIFLPLIVSVWDSGPSLADAALGLQPHWSADTLLSPTARSIPSHPWPCVTVAAHGNPQGRTYTCPRQGSWLPMTVFITEMAVCSWGARVKLPPLPGSGREGLASISFVAQTFTIKVQRSVNKKLWWSIQVLSWENVHNWLFNLGSLGNHQQRNLICLGSPVVSSGGGLVTVAAWQHSLRGIGLINKVLVLAL